MHQGKSKVIVLSQDLLKSEAYRSLRNTALIVFNDLRMKCQIKGAKGSKKNRSSEIEILNNGKLVYTYEEAGKKKPPISRSRFMRAIDELVEKGLVDIIHSGNAGRKGDVNLYAISDRWRRYGTPLFEEKTRPRDMRTGRGFAAYWKRKKAQSSISEVNTERAFQSSKRDTDKSE